MAGSEQVVVSPAARWRASVTIPIADRRYGPLDRQNAVLAYRGLMNRLKGRAGVVLLPVCDGRGPYGIARVNAPASAPEGDVRVHGVPHSDGTGFSDDAGYDQDSTGAASGEAALNATEILIGLAAGLPLLPGMRFSFPDGRMHEIADVLGSEGGLIRVSVVPWLRAAYPAGTRLEFERPVVRMRLASDETGALALSLNKFATVTLDLVEAF